MSSVVRVIASAILYSVIARVMLYSVIARRALPDVAISSKPSMDNVDSVLSLRRFFTSFRMTLLVCTSLRD